MGLLQLVLPHRLTMPKTKALPAIGLRVRFRERLEGAHDRPSFRLGRKSAL